MLRLRIFYIVVALAALFMISSVGSARAECVKRPLTADEQAYYEQVTRVMDSALPAPDGWRRQVTWMNVPKAVCEGFEEGPIQFGGQFKFVEITELDRKKEEAGRRQKELEEKALAASARGDMAGLSRFQNEIQRTLREDLAELQKLQEEARNSPKPEQIIAKFRVNEKRKALGKNLEIAAIPDTSKTFERINAKGTDRETITKMLYIGGWRVEDFIKNWNMLRPDASYEMMENTRLELTGKRQQVEDYISNHLDVAGISGGGALAAEAQPPDAGPMAAASTSAVSASESDTQEEAPWPSPGSRKASIIFSYMGDSPFKSFFQETVRLRKIMELYDFNVLLKHDQVQPWLDLSEQDERIVNVKDVPTKQNLFSYIKRLTDEKYIIDIWIISHGGPDGRFRASLGQYSDVDNDIVTAEDILTLAGADGGSSGYRAVPIRMVHHTSCWGSRLAPAWHAVGANTVVGSRLVNFYPTQTIPFAKAFAEGRSVVNAYRDANTAASRTAVQGWVVLDAAGSNKSKWGGGCGIGNTPLGRKSCAKDFFVFRGYFIPEEWSNSLSGKENMNWASEMQITGKLDVWRDARWRRPQM
jgi:hypothetical protein